MAATLLDVTKISLTPFSLRRGKRSSELLVLIESKPSFFKTVPQVFLPLLLLMNIKLSRALANESGSRASHHLVLYCSTFILKELIQTSTQSHHLFCGTNLDFSRCYRDAALLVGAGLCIWRRNIVSKLSYTSIESIRSLARFHSPSPVRI